MPQSNKPSLFTFGNTISSQNARKNKKKLKKDRKFFVQLSTAAQVRSGDAQELLQLETWRETLSLSSEDEICLGNKADLLPCLKDEKEFPTSEPIIQSAVFEESTQLNILRIVWMLLQHGKSETRELEEKLNIICNHY